MWFAHHHGWEELLVPLRITIHVGVDAQLYSSPDGLERSVAQVLQRDGDGLYLARGLRGEHALNAFGRVAVAVSLVGIEAMLCGLQSDTERQKAKE